MKGSKAPRRTGSGFGGGPSVAFAIQTTLAALLALALAALGGTQHPWWAAMTVWLVAQPTRGLLVERALARLIGTVVGTGAGFAILVWLGSSPVLALAVLALWLALCAGVGSQVRHFRTYGLVLAGYTASIILLFGLGREVDPVDLALDRLTCTVIGIVCSAAMSLWRLSNPTSRITERFQAVVRDVRLEVRNALRGSGPVDGTPLIETIAVLNRDIDEDVAGSFRGRFRAVQARRTLGLLLELVALVSTRTPMPAIHDSPRGADIEPEIEDLADFARRQGEPAIAQVLEALERRPSFGVGDARFRGVLAHLNRDAFWRAALRPVLALMIASTLWFATGWSEGPLVVMSATLFATLFSSHAQGNRALIDVLSGTLGGAVLGTAYRLLVLPQATGWVEVLLVLSPVLLMSAWLMRQRLTAKLAIDLTMTFLLTAQPMTAFASTPLQALSMGLAITAGVLVAIAIYWGLLPATATVRRRRLAGRMRRLSLAAGQTNRAADLERLRDAMRATLVRLLDDRASPDPMFDVAARRLAAASRRCLPRPQRQA